MVITEIQIIMTIALAFYAVGIVLGRMQRAWGVKRWVHVSAAFVGFGLDMWATWKMETLRVAGWSSTFSYEFLMAHTIVSVAAILMFITMVTLGWMQKISSHRRVAWYAFTPSWVVSYTSGLALVA